MATKKARYNVSVSDRMLREIKKYQEANNIATCSGAIQELISVGLQTIKREEWEAEHEENG